MVYDHQDNRGENAIIQLFLWLDNFERLITDWGTMILLPRSFRGYRGNIPAAPVESAPMPAMAHWWS